MKTLALLLAAFPVALAVYAYALYPAALRLLAALRPAPPRPPEPDELPSVSICLPVHDEAAQVRGALDSLLALDYPNDRLQLLVVSDASTDGTDDIVREYADRGIELLRIPTRGGKTAAENAATEHLRGDIVLNTDASVRPHPASLRALARHFADPTVGVASGRDVSVAADAECANATETGYVGYEMAIRAMETRLGGIVGASGCLYAIRAHLHRAPFPQHLSRDFASALIAREHGFHSVSVDDALCVVPRTSSLRREYYRKVRTISRGMETLVYKRALLSVPRYGGFAVRLWSHKVCRWAVPPAALPGAAGLALLAPSTPLAAAALVLGAIAVALAAVGWMWPEERPMPRVVAMAAFAVAGNAAVLHALVRLVRGADDHIWEPTRRAVLPTAH